MKDFLKDCKSEKEKLKKNQYVVLCHINLW